MFDRPGIFYFNDPYVIFNQDWVLDPDKVHALRQHPFIVADFSSEHYGSEGLTYVYDFLEENGLNFILLSHDPYDHQILPRMFFYPHWYYFAVKNCKLIDIESPRKYKLGCLNSSARPHRIAIWLALKDHLKNHEILIDFRNFNSLRSDDVKLTDNELQQWESLRSTLPIRNDLPFTIHIQADELVNSYLHLVTETTVIPKIFITEKTWKPIAAGNLFLIFGNKGSIKYLRDQGVDVFDDIIDHSYDAEPDWRKRMKKLHRTIDILMQENLEKIFEQTLSRRQANRDNFFSGEFGKIYHSSIVKFLDNHVPVR